MILPSFDFIVSFFSSVIVILTFELINAKGSYIKNNVLILNEDVSRKIYLNCNYKDYINATVTINVKDEVFDVTNQSMINNKIYHEVEYGVTNLQDGITLSNVISATLNNVVYNNISIKNEKVNETTKTYFIVENLLKISTDGEILFYDETSSSFIQNNNLGIIYLEVLTNELNYEHTKYFKLNNYKISQDATTKKFNYYLNGAEIQDALKYSLVDENGMLFYGCKVTDEYITANGITINIFNGSYSGTKTVDTKMFIKVYVSQNNFNYGENYKLFELS